ncbi:MAG: class I SAM-dependent methyltransferase [Thermomicrobiales bacterium]
MAETVLDQWASWLLQRRHGGDPDELQYTLDRVARVRDRVLDNAGIADGETVLDVGTGDGLIAFGALERVGQRGTVILSDVSRDLLDHDRDLAERLGVGDRCRFVLAAAEDLASIADASVDVVTTRSVLAYVGDKRRAVAEFGRVLRPGGRISLYEPINRLCETEPPHRFAGYDVSPVLDLVVKLNLVFEQRLPAVSDPMLNFDERDLLAYVEWAGFAERHLELRVDVAPRRPQPWETFLRVAPNPLAPTLGEAMAEALTPSEAERFSIHLRPLVKRGDGTFAVAVAYLWAVKG